MLQEARRFPISVGEIPPWFVRTFIGLAIVACGLGALSAAIDLDLLGVLLPAGIGTYMVWCMRGWARSVSDPQRNFVELGETGLTVTLGAPFPVRRVQANFPYSSIDGVETVARHDWSPLVRWPLQSAWNDGNRPHIDVHLKKVRWMLFKGGFNAAALRVVHIDVPNGDEFISELKARVAAGEREVHNA